MSKIVLHDCTICNIANCGRTKNGYGFCATLSALNTSSSVQDIIEKGVVYAPQEFRKSNISFNIVTGPGLECDVILRVNFVRD